MGRFHPPHLSEEEDAWVPAWLQTIAIRNQSPSFSEHPQPFQETQQTIRTENGDDGCSNTFHLYLSAMEDNNSSIAFPPSSINHDVPYQLRLSTNEESQYSLNLILTTSQDDGFKLNEALLVHDPDAKVNPEDTHIIPSRQRDDLGVPQEESVRIKDQKRVNPKADARSRKVSIKDAIELAVAASEVLTIHDVLKDDELALELSADSSVVLEAAVRVKKARLEKHRETLTSYIEESNEIDFDFCSDLNELTMSDAYEDVGLTVANNHGDLSAYGSISHVEDSFASESYVSKAKQKFNVQGGLDVDSLKQQHKQVTKEHVEYEALGIHNAVLSCDIDPVFSCSVKQTGLCITETEGLEIGDLSSSKTIFRSSILCESFGYNEREEYKMTNLVPERFQSRWFGGWTWKNEANVPAATDDRYKRIIPKVFANEASSLSESADNAPDQNSCIRRLDKEGKNVSQSSIALEKGSNGGDILSSDVAVSPSVNSEYSNDKVASVSDDVAATPDLSQLDPLCSVVPCSLNSNNVLSQSCKQKVNLEMNLDSMAEERTRDESLPCEFAPTLVPCVIETPDHDQTAKGNTSHVDKEMSLRKCKSYLVPGKKRVCFAEAEISYPKIKKLKMPQTRLKDPLISNRLINLQPRSRAHEVDRCSITDKTMLFQDLEFLLTGFSVKKYKQIKNLIQKNGGVVVDDIPSPLTYKGKRGSKYKSQLLPLILCPRRLLTAKFLYGCAVNACILKVDWLFDSLDECLILPPKKYIVLKERATESCMVIGMSVNVNSCIFDNIAIMLHGKPDFYSKMATVVKHGGGLVFKSFHWLVKSLDSKRVCLGAIVLEDENVISRQLKQCALERKISMTSFDWIINSLYAGRLLPSPELEFSSASMASNKLPVELSEEI